MWSFGCGAMKRGPLTHWGRVTHLCVGNLTIIGSDNGLSPGRRQAIIGTNAGILLIGPLGTNFSEILIEILTFSFKKMRFKVSSAKWRPFCLGLNGLRGEWLVWAGGFILGMICIITSGNQGSCSGGCYWLHGQIIALCISYTYCRVHFVYAPSQWETTLHCNVVSHWLGAYTKWSLRYHQIFPIQRTNCMP